MVTARSYDAADRLDSALEDAHRVAHAAEDRLREAVPKLDSAIVHAHPDAAP